ncbi:MAG: hypothetical protein ACPGWS_06850, partial [Solirubrobacterales bacterium]
TTSQVGEVGLLHAITVTDSRSFPQPPDQLPATPLTNLPIAGVPEIVGGVNAVSFPAHVLLVSTSGAVTPEMLAVKTVPGSDSPGSMDAAVPGSRTHVSGRG